MTMRRETADGSFLDDLCPVCGKPIKDGEPWSMNKDNEMCHEICAEESDDV